MEELTTYTLEEISIGKGTYGIGAPAIPFDKNKRTYLRITDINEDGTLNKDGLMSVEEEKADEYLLAPNDIVFARTGNSTGRTYFYEESDGIFCYAGFLIKFTLNPNKVNPRMLKYYTHSKAYYDWVHSFDTGGTRGNINAKTYGQMPVTLPSKERQDRIVEICKSLDDKIEVNKQINDNLEQQAQALFKSWFVDFEPFLREEFFKSDSLFGDIPVGWHIVAIKDLSVYITDYVANGSFASLRENVRLYDKPNYAHFIRNTDLKAESYKMYVDKHSYEFLSKSVLEGGEIIISNVGDVGSVFLCPKLEKPMTLGNNIILLRPKKDYLTFYLYMLFKGGIGQHLIDGVTGGSAQRKFNKTDFRSIKVMMPPVNILIKFDRIVKPIFSKIEENRDEISRLTSLRDTLLPKLMSGELKINDINN